MDRTTSPGTIAGLHTDGNPGLGIPVSYAQAADFNNPQEEIINLIEGAGLNPDSEDLTQVLQAVRAIAALGLVEKTDIPTLSNAVGDPTHDISVSAGKCVDKAASLVMVLAATTKRLDAVWAAGTGQGGRATATTLVGAKWFHVFAIAKVDGTVDVGFDTADNAVNLLTDAAGYTKTRHLGMIYWTGAEIGLFLQRGDNFYWKTPVCDVVSAALSAAGSLHALSMPSQPGMTAVFDFSMRENSGTQRHNPIILSSPLLADAVPTSVAEGDGADVFSVSILENAGADPGVFMQCRMPTDSAQVRVRAKYATGDYHISTLGWIDPRGKDS
jgi:hypothetical protein